MAPIENQCFYESTMYKLFVLGIADSILSAGQEKILTRCVAIVGTKRFIALTAHLACRFVPITPLPAALDSIRTLLQTGNVAVLASGDPLFYGIGRRLLAEFPEDIIQISPALSSLQRACALFKIPWDDAKITSLHGRSTGHIPGLLLPNQKNLVLTDADNSPDRLAGQLLDYLQLIRETVLPDRIEMLVAEDLGLASEKLFRGTLSEAGKQTVFSAEYYMFTGTRRIRDHTIPLWPDGRFN